MPTHDYTRNREVVRRFQKGDPDAAQELLTLNDRLVSQYAHRFAPYAGSHTAEDLAQEGRLGVLHAATKFDLSRGTSFSKYAVPWVKQHIIRAIEATGHLIHTPIGRPRGPELEPQSLDHTYGAENDLPLCDTLEDGADVEQQAVTRLFVGQAVAALPPDEQEALVLRFGLNGSPDCTLQEASERLGLSREGTRHREVRALRHLREMIGASLGSPATDLTRRARTHTIKEGRACGVQSGG